MGLHPDQHPPYIGVPDDRHPRGGGVFHLRKRRALEALLRVLEGVEVGDGTAGEGLDPDADPGAVHHLEHDLHPLALLAQKLRKALPAVAQVDQTGGRTVDTHLLLDLSDRVVVPLSRRPVVAHEKLGDEEDRDPARPRGVPLDPGQDGMDDVLHDIAVPGGDENFRSLDAECPVRLADRLRLQVPHVGAGARFGQGHRPAPNGFVHLRQIPLFLRLRSIGFNQVGGPFGQREVADEGAVVAEPLLGRHGDDPWKTLAAVFGGDIHRRPAPLPIDLGAAVEALGDMDIPPLQAAPLPIPLGEGGENGGRGELLRLVQRHVEHVPRKIRVERRLAELLDMEHFIKNELLIPRIDDQIGHT